MLFLVLRWEEEGERRASAVSEDVTIRPVTNFFQALPVLVM
jgi:hypothetical protein